MTSTRHSYKAYLISTPDVELPVKGGSITLDTGQYPHVTASLEISAPGVWEFTPIEYPDGEGFGYGEGPYGGGGYGGWGVVWSFVPDLIALAALDPRLDARVRIDVVMTDAYGADYPRSFDLGLRERDIRHRDADITISLASDEGLLQDFAPLADDTAPLALDDSIRDIVNYVLDAAIPGTALEASPAGDADLSVDADPDAFTWKAGQSAIDFLMPLVQAAGFRLVCDESRAWTLRDEDYAEPGAASIRHAVNLTDADERISRESDAWYDAAVTRYTWTDSLGVEHVQVDAYALTTPYTRLQLFERDTPYPGSGFSEYAVRRTQQRGREIEAHAVSDWRVTTEQSLTIYLDDEPTQTGNSQSVTFDLSNDEMTVSARTTDTADGTIDLLTGFIDGLAGYIDGL